ncbi:unnamed protein product [Linum trigynum]|uniref:Uncharacterized protein n=1 Tax=Linum trigynum TaxID=586398 RepID=A0AAV2FE88_9ROSI
MHYIRGVIGVKACPGRPTDPSRPVSSLRVGTGQFVYRDRLGTSHLLALQGSGQLSDGSRFDPVTLSNNKFVKF